MYSEFLYPTRRPHLFLAGVRFLVLPQPESFANYLQDKQILLCYITSHGSSYFRRFR